MTKSKSKYSVGFGSYTADGYEQVAESGPYRTRFGARRAMKKFQGMRVIDLPEDMTKDWPLQKRRQSRVLGATIERFTDEHGTQEGWDYDYAGRLTEHWKNW